MSDPTLNKTIGAIFRDLLNTPARKLVVLPSEAEEIVAKRVELLSVYAQPGMPGELKEEFTEAIKFTDGCHMMGKNLVALEHAISSQSKLSDAHLLQSAAAFFNSKRPTGGPFADQ